MKAQTEKALAWVLLAASTAGFIGEAARCRARTMTSDCTYLKFTSTPTTDGPSDAEQLAQREAAARARLNAQGVADASH